MSIQNVSLNTSLTQFNNSVSNKDSKNEVNVELAIKDQANKVGTNNANRQDEKITKEQLEDVIKGMNEFIQPAHTSIKFVLHEDLQEYYVTIVDDKSKEVIREIPSKKFLDMYAAMREFVGLIVDEKI